MQWPDGGLGHQGAELKYISWHLALKHVNILGNSL
jgi:hypothetical protein